MTKAPLPGAAAGPRLGRLGSRWQIAAAALVLAVLAAAIGLWWFRPRGDSEDTFEQARAALDRVDLDRVRAVWLKLKASPQHASQAALLRGGLLLRKGFYYPALDDLERAKQDPQLRLPALVFIGEAWYHLGRHVEAQAALQEVLRADPDSVQVHRWLAASYYDMGTIHEALIHLERTAQLDPADFRPHRLMGLIYKDYERYADAALHYEESLRRKSDQPDRDNVREELATCQTRLWRYREALTTLAPCPDSPAALALRAECHHALGDFTQAKDALAQALVKEPDFLDALVLQGTLLLEDKKPAEAIAIFQRAVKAHPMDHLAHFKLAQAYLQTGDQDQAQTEQKKADYMRELRKVFSQLHQAAWDNPGDIQVRLRLAQLARELGRPDLEDVWLKSAAALQPLAGSTP